MLLSRVWQSPTLSKWVPAVAAVIMPEPSPPGTKPMDPVVVHSECIQEREELEKRLKDDREHNENVILGLTDSIRGGTISRIASTMKI